MHIHKHVGDEACCMSTYMLDGNRLACATLDGLVHFSEGPACTCQPKRSVAAL